MNEIISLTDEMVDDQRRKLLVLGRQFVPNLTSEDILQPNDYPVLEENPLFRYEEGILAGMQTLQSAYKALQKSL